MTSVSAPTAVTVDSLAKSYGRRQVLRDVSFTVSAGAMVGIEGENGAGKSTLMQCLVGLLRPDAGRVTVRGRLGYCPQQPTLIDVLTVREQLELFAAGYGLDRDESARSAARLADIFGCAKFLDTRCDQLSGGTRQKVNLMVALLHDPQVLILDEPYQGFDYDTYVIFWDYAEQFRSEGGTVIVVSHMHTEKHRFDILLKLVDGRVVEAAHDLVRDDLQGSAR